MLKSAALARLALIVGGLLLWEALVRLTGVSPILVAPPSAILWQMAKIVASASQVPDFYGNAAITVAEVVVAFAVTATLGMALGVLFATSKLVGDAFEPIMLVLYAVPKIILYPIFVLVLGIGMVPKIVFGIVVGIFAVVFNTAAGLRQIEPSYVSLARTIGYGRLQIFLKVELPAAAPAIVAGLRLGFGYTLIGVITGELLVVNQGLGFLINWASINYFTPQLFALIALTLALGVAGNAFFSLLERRWTKG